MKINLSKVPKGVLLGIAGLLLVLSTFYVMCDRPTLNHKIDYWQGQYDAERKLAIAGEEIALKKIGELQSEIAMKDGAIDSANTVIATLQEAQDTANDQISSLNVSLSEATTDAERVPILVSLVDEWKGKFTLAQSTIAEKDRIIEATTVKYNLQVQISDEYKANWEREKALRINCENGLGLYEKRVNQLERKSRLKNVLFIGGIAALSALVIAK
jgi:chromosome segregation ATPase